MLWQGAIPATINQLKQTEIYKMTNLEFRTFLDLLTKYSCSEFYELFETVKEKHEKEFMKKLKIMFDRIEDRTV
jgi:iron uptake system EfeUOB component EfeO/EfeM